MGAGVCAQCAVYAVHSTHHFSLPAPAPSTQHPAPSTAQHCQHQQPAAPAPPVLPAANRRTRDQSTRARGERQGDQPQPRARAPPATIAQ
jgi:hypothetical protein